MADPTGGNEILEDGQPVELNRLRGEGRAGKLPLTAEALREEPSGNLFGLTQNVAMGWDPDRSSGDPYLILSTQGGLRNPDGSPAALGYHTGHWELELLVRHAAATFEAEGAVPFAGHCSDPCDGRSQGTTAMFDSLPYRNDAAMVMRRLIRSLPLRRGVLGVATCDKGLPAMMMALAGSADLPAVLVPGGVTLPGTPDEDTASIQTIGARFANDMIDLEYAATMGCRVCGSAGGGCQFLGTAATSQVIGESLGMSLPHSALSPSGEPIWLDMARRSALALIRLAEAGTSLRTILDHRAVENALIVHAAFGGSTNLLLHLPAVAHAAGLTRPTVEDWAAASRATPRLVDALPNGPANHSTVEVFMAGGVPEVMLHLRTAGLLNTDVPTVSGQSLDDVLDWWEGSERRHNVRRHLTEQGGIDCERVIFNADVARSRGIGGTIAFPVGNIAPNGSVIKATAIDPTLFDAEGVYRHRGPARVFTSEAAAIAALKGQSDRTVEAGDVLVLIGVGPMGTGMEETYQLTSALKHLPWGKTVPVVTDARFSGVSTGACVGHVGPEALTGGPIGKLRDGDEIELVIDRSDGSASVDLVAPSQTGEALSQTVEPADAVLAGRAPHPDLAVHGALPADTRLWAALVEASGGTWGGCVYDVDRVLAVLKAGTEALAAEVGER